MSGSMDVKDGKRYGYIIDQVIAADRAIVTIIARRSPEGTPVSLRLPEPFMKWVAENWYSHRGHIWHSQTAINNGQFRHDIGCITPTLCLARCPDGEYAYFAAFDHKHVQDIVAEHGVEGFDGEFEIIKVSRLDDVPEDDRELPVFAIGNDGAHCTVAEYPDLHDPDRHDSDATLPGPRR